MTWVCRVCGEKAIEILDYAVSKQDKKGYYKCSRLAFCKQHLPYLRSIAQYTKEQEE